MNQITNVSDGVDCIINDDWLDEGELNNEITLTP